jgi:hypothetical protein
MKELSLKDLMTVNYAPGQDDLIAFQAKKRKQAMDTGPISENDSLNHQVAKLKEAQRRHLESYYRKTQ